jgi:hypothetical protein
VAAAQDGEQNQCADDGNNDRAKTTEAVGEEGEHPLTSSGDTPSVCIWNGGWRRGRTSAQLPEVRVSILLYDALDFSTDRDDGGGQTRESLSRIASPSAAVARLDPAWTVTHVALCDYRIAGCVRLRQSRRLRAGHAYKIRAHWISLSRARWRPPVVDRHGQRKVR